MKKALLVGLLVGVIVLGTVAFAAADSATYTGAGTPRVASGTVTVTAMANPKLTLTIVTPDPAQTVDFGAQDPMSGATDTVDLTVQSNKAYTITKTVGGQVALMGLATDPAINGATGTKTAGRLHTDTYTLNIPWDTDPDVPMSATVQYTVTQ
jgi:hypothetical protein